MKCIDIQEATRFKMTLDAAGIESFIPNEHSATVAPFAFFAGGGVRLQVAKEDYEKAKEVLEDFNLPPEEEIDSADH